MHPVFISYNNADRHLASELSLCLESAGYTTWYYDRDTQVGFNYMDYVGTSIVECSAMVLLISPLSVHSAQVTREVMRACEENKFILPLLCGMTYAEFQKQAPIWRQALAGIAAVELPGEGIVAIVPRLVEALESRGIAASPGAGPATVVSNGTEAAAAEAPQLSRRSIASDPGDGSGAVPLDSKFYIVRKTDPIFLDAVANRQSIILIKGPRQMGKTSLLARGLQEARESGSKVVLTDFQQLDQAHFASAAAFYRGLAELVSDRLDLDFDPQRWTPERIPNANLAFQKFMTREVLARIDRPLVWGLDEVDRLFTCDFAAQVFGLIRSWHNERALEPDGPWGRLSMAIVHATEPHLFIQNVNESPFNVGAKIALEDFKSDEVAELNRRHGSPLRDAGELERFYQLMGGHPFLTRRGLQELSKPGASLDTFAKSAARDEGPFGDHLRRMLVLLAKDADLTAAVRNVLSGEPSMSQSMSRDSFFRLRSAGVFTGDSAPEARMRCGLYADYLKRQML
jgi:hypothetical protein